LLSGYKVPKSRVDSIMNMPNTAGKARKLVDLFKCKISIFSNEDKTFYPSVNEKIVELVMSPEYYREYYKIQEDIKVDFPELFKNTKDLTRFFNGIRRAVNKVNLTSPKIEWTIHKINESISKNKKILIYSNWLDAGINIIKGYLKETSIPFSLVTGSLSKEAKDLNVKNYNSGKTSVILITASGSEGLDLKGTRTVVVLEPHWNETRIKQVIGRAVRFKSHWLLPKEERRVDIYRLILKKPEHRKRGDNMGSGDEILFKLSHSKEKLIEDFYRYIALLAIEKDSSCF